jgi:hypothetical protein
MHNVRTMRAPSHMRPNPPLQRTPLRGHKIAAILRVRISSNDNSIYQFGTSGAMSNRV